MTELYNEYSQQHSAFRSLLPERDNLLPSTTQKNADTNRRKNKSEKAERRRLHKEKKLKLVSQVKSTDSASEGRSIRSKSNLFDLIGAGKMDKQDSQTSDLDLLDETSAFSTSEKPRDTFSCVCSTCGSADNCISDFYCTAITHREGDTEYTSYGCLNHNEAFMELAYCEGGKPGNSQFNTLRTVCCAGHMCNNIPPPMLPPTTAQNEHPTSQNSSNMTYIPHVLYFMIPLAVLIILLIGLVAVLIYKKLSTSKKKKRRKDLPKSYLGDNLSAQPLTEDSSIELPDPTSGSGAGLPMLMQRTVAKSVTLVSQIGTGKYGNVFQGLYQGSFVAVKIFLSKDIDSWTRENEIYTTLLLRHDNILGFLASDMTSCDSVTQFWLICHYHENGSLYDFLNQSYNIITLPQCLLMLYSTAAGLVHLHTEITGTGTQAKPAIAHRDIKSKNILVKDDGSCCIADFGLAVIHKSKENILDLGHNNKVGTKRYMAPEVLSDSMNHSDFDNFKRADVYAFSLVMWETLQCTVKDGHAPKYLMPYGGMVQNDPTIDEMRHVVITQQRRPPIPNHWCDHKIFKSMRKLIQECWSENPAARLTILRIKKSLGYLMEETRDLKENV